MFFKGIHRIQEENGGRNGRNFMIRISINESLSCSALRGLSQIELETYESILSLFVFFFIFFFSRGILFLFPKC